MKEKKREREKRREKKGREKKNSNYQKAKTLINNLEAVIRQEKEKIDKKEKRKIKKTATKSTGGVV